MPQYEYHCVEVPMGYREDVRKKDYVTAIQAYESLIREEAHDGWELDKIDSVASYQNPGCLGRIFGVKGTVMNHKIMIFRRLAG